MDHFKIDAYDVVLHNGFLDIFHHEKFVAGFLPSGTEQLLSILNLHEADIHQAAQQMNEALKHAEEDYIATELRAKIWTGIQRFGFFMMEVAGKPPFAYTIGLGPIEPELVIIGVSFDEVPEVFRRIIELQKKGTRFESGRTYTATNILGKLPIHFAQVDRDKYDKYALVAIRWHQTRDFPLLQVVWPDEQGRFPWQQGYDESLRVDQPLLFPMLQRES